eukprot:6734884-Lingulodinium_polyedra.AAC.1
MTSWNREADPLALADPGIDAGANELSDKTVLGGAVRLDLGDEGESGEGDVLRPQGITQCFPGRVALGATLGN